MRYFWFCKSEVTVLKLYGRHVIYANVEEVNRGNLLDVLGKAIPTFEQNTEETQELYDYYRGKHCVYERTKTERPEICNKIVENRANEIVSFKTGYLMGEPIMYVSRNDKVLDELNLFNEYMFEEDKASKDKQLADWFHISGTSYRMIFADKNNNDDDAPFEIYTLDPRSTFVVYSSGLGNERLMGVIVVYNQSIARYCCYTKNRYFEVEKDKIVKDKPNPLKEVPIIEYPANVARLGAFEIVIDLIDELNNLASNRMDGVEQFVQALMVFKGVDITSDDYAKLRKEGAIKVPPEGDIKYLIQELNQSQTQELVDYTYQTMLDICGMPNRNGGTSTSDTGSAVVLRDGWSAAETRAKDTEMMFKLSEKEFIRIAIKIVNQRRSLNLKANQIEPRFTRRNYENIQQKAQVLCEMLNNDMIAPKLAFEHCGMFPDAEVAYTESMEYAEKKLKEEVERLERERQDEIDAAKGNNGADTFGRTE